ncbi:hypothetical protein HK104_001236 [Borealophlyctis nickersoniae]|nr:hypothetical protein HK104_001236 [Borealophlyctis nickersoniae]
MYRKKILEGMAAKDPLSKALAPAQPKPYLEMEMSKVEWLGIHLLLRALLELQAKKAKWRLRRRLVPRRIWGIKISWFAANQESWAVTAAGNVTHTSATDNGDPSSDPAFDVFNDQSYNHFPSDHHHAQSETSNPLYASPTATTHSDSYSIFWPLSDLRPLPTSNPFPVPSSTFSTPRLIHRRRSIHLPNIPNHHHIPNQFYTPAGAAGGALTPFHGAIPTRLNHPPPPFYTRHHTALDTPTESHVLTARPDPIPIDAAPHLQHP